MIKNGIDVSKYQGVIDWGKVAREKDFAILKVTKKNNLPEESFERNYAGASKTNIHIGVYRYVYAKNVSDAIKEANGIVQALKGKDIDFGVWLDMEDKSIRGLGKHTLTEIINTEENILNGAGYKVGIYCNWDWYKNVLDSNNLKNRFPFWIARYTILPWDAQKYAVMWQYSSKGKVSGISGNVDVNYLYDSENCTLALPTLKKGSRGIQVTRLQGCLKTLGYNLKIDGIYGNETARIVKKWQRDFGIMSDGIYGSQSFYKMKSILEK